MVYNCPQAIMESISRSPNYNNSNSNSNNNHHHDAANPNNVPQDNVLVPFPSLHLNNPPTDSSEEGTAASASAGDGATASSSLAASSSDGLQNNDGRQQHPSSSSEEHSTKVTSQPPIIPNLVGTSDPSFRIKTFLNELVAYSKEGGVKHSGGNSSGGDEKDCRKKKKRKLDQQPSSQQQPQKEPALSSNSNHSHSSEPIDAIMHWMDSFQDDETIQLMCLQSLPTLLENPTYRRTAQSDGLASIVLYNMAAFPTNSLLILTAFHTLVVLLRPLGTNEGMVHKASSVAMRERSTMSCRSDRGIRSISKGVGGVGGGTMNSTTTAIASIHSVNFKGTQHHPPRSKQRRSNSTTSSTSSSSSSSVTSNTHLYSPSIQNHLTNWEENGVRVMLDSLRRFSNDKYVQAMGCWAMVNAALYPSLKSGLTRLGGVYAVTNAMMLHPDAEAVQFRGLFALINLVIPERDSNNERSGSSIHSHVYQIARLTILAMKNFHTNKSILNRGCLVLRNLSLTPSFVKILGRTPGCVDMLLHCRQVCPRDALVQRSARTIMVMIQMATEKEQLATTTTMKNNNKAHHNRHSFTLTQPFSVPSRQEEEEAVNRSSSSTPTLSSSESQQKR